MLTLLWEGDLVKEVRRKNQPALMTLTERLTRFEIVIKIPNYRAETCRQELQKIVDYHLDWLTPSPLTMLLSSLT